MLKCCPNCPNPGRGCRARPHFSSARFAHFSRIPHFCRVSLFRWISAGFGKFGEERCGERSAVQLGLFSCRWHSISIAQFQYCTVSALRISSIAQYQHCSATQFNGISIVQQYSALYCCTLQCNTKLDNEYCSAGHLGPSKVQMHNLTYGTLQQCI